MSEYVSDVCYIELAQDRQTVINEGRVLLKLGIHYPSNFFNSRSIPYTPLPDYLSIFSLNRIILTEPFNCT